MEQVGHLFIVDPDIKRRAEIFSRLSSGGIKCDIFADISELPKRNFESVIFLVDHDGPFRKEVDGWRNVHAPVSARIEFSYASTCDKAVLAIREGASDFVAWPAETALLQRAIARAAEDCARIGQAHRQGAQARQKVAALTARERQVLADVLNGCTTERIATRLAISPRTVDIYRRNVLLKLDARNTAQAVAIALKSGEFRPAL